MTRIHYYSIYQRLWHWLQALCILLLILTGLQIHRPGTLPLLPFASAISLHNLLGFVLIGDAVLGLIYHLLSGQIRQYVPQPRGFASQATQQAMYYLGGIFRHEPHPHQRTPQDRLNPLQKLTYLMVLNVLLPLQVLSGLLLWGAQRWPSLVNSIGGLGPLAKVHTLVAWLFVAFLIMHIYLTTTGHAPLAHIKTMVKGYEEAKEEHHHEQHAAA